MTNPEDEKLHEQLPNYKSTVETSREEQKLLETRIWAFHKVIWLAIIIISSLVLLAIVLGGFYIAMFFYPVGTIAHLAHYWHMPLMFLLASTTMLFITLKVAASFGQSNEAKDNNHPAESLLDKVTELCNKVIELISNSESK